MRHLLDHPVRWGALLLLLPLVLAACGSASVDADLSIGDAAAPTTHAPDETTAYSPVDSITLEGEAPPQTTFTQTYARYAATILVEETDTLSFADQREVLSLAESVRDAEVEALLDITVTEEATTDMNAEAVRRIQMGEAPDLFAFSSAKTAALLATSGHLADLATLETLNLHEPAFDRNLIEALSLVEHIYLLFGDATVGDKAATAVLWLDIPAAEAAGIDVNALLAQVRSGDWTVDALQRLAADELASLDGDAALPLLLGAGGRFFVKGADDIPTLDLGDDFSRAYNAMQGVMQNAAVNEDAPLTLGRLDGAAEGRMALPLPVIDSDEPYRTFVDPAEAACIAVPVSPEDPVRTGDILNAYFIHSTDTVASILRVAMTAGYHEDVLDDILSARECLLGVLFGWGNLDEALINSIGQSESEFRDAAEMRMTAAAKAMEIVLNRLR